MSANLARYTAQSASNLWGPIVVPPELNERVLKQLIALFMAWNMDFLANYQREHGQPFPSIYQFRLRYLAEEPGQEVWLTAPWVVANGGSVCHSLATFRAAELRVKGEDAWPIVSSMTRPDGSKLWHVQVERGPGTRTLARPRGQIEDPSLILGMGKNSDEVRMLGPSHHVDAAAGVTRYQR